MQSYIEILATDLQSDSLDKLLDNFKTIMSSSSGTAFPTVDLQVGMWCRRTDLSKTYQLTSTGPSVWSEIAIGMPVPVAQGGTGATTASAARTNLGLAALAIKATVGTADIDALAVDTAQLAADAVETAKVLDGAITAPKLGAGAVVGHLGFTPANKAGETFTGYCAFQSTVAPQVGILSFDNSAAAGPGVDMYRQSSSPAVNDIGPYINFIMRTAVGPANDEVMAQLITYLVNATGGAEDGGFDIATLEAGTLLTQLFIRNGLVLGAATGGFKGRGTINTTGVYINGDAIGINKAATYQEQQTSGTDGGTFTQDAWQTRLINTEVNDPDGIASLSSNKISLSAGRWRIDWWATGYVCRAHKTRIYNVTDAALIAYGLAGYGETDTQTTLSHGSAVVTLAGTKEIRLDHYCKQTRATDGFGKASSTDGVEVYSQVTVTKLSD